MDSMKKQRGVDLTWLTKILEGAAASWTLDRRWLNEALLVYWGYALLGLLTLWAEASLLRGLLSAVLALFGPGYALMAVLFPRRNSLDVVERAALAGAVSLAVGGLLGFLLTFSPWGLSLGPVMVASALFCLFCLLVSWVRQLRLIDSKIWEGESVLAWYSHWRQWLGGQGRASLWVTAGLMALVVSGAVALGWGLMAPAVEPPMTEFYILNSDGQAGNYPATIAAGQALPIQFGVVNREAEAAKYEVRARMAGELLDGSGPMVLRPGETWLGKLQLAFRGSPAAAAPDGQVVEFVLDRDGQPYRSLHLWLAVEDAGTAALVEAVAAPVAIEQ